MDFHGLKIGAKLEYARAHFFNLTAYHHTRQTGTLLEGIFAKHHDMIVQIDL